MIAEIIAVGSEMLTPHRQDTNSLYLTEQLNNLGVSVAFKTIVGDSLEHLTSAARIALSRADIILISGGLGPTEDDLTREALAEALGLSLRRDDKILAGLRQRFADRGIPLLTTRELGAIRLRSDGEVWRIAVPAPPAYAKAAPGIVWEGIGD